MPSRPPETKFYEDTENSALWRDLSRQYEDFLGDKESEWTTRRGRFETIVNDMLVRLREVKQEPV
jgi:hypothetical protein